LYVRRSDGRDIYLANGEKKTLLLCFYTLLLFIAHFAETKQPSGTLHNKMTEQQQQQQQQ